MTERAVREVRTAVVCATNSCKKLKVSGIGLQLVRQIGAVEVPLGVFRVIGKGHVLQTCRATGNGHAPRDGAALVVNGTGEGPETILTETITNTDALLNVNVNKLGVGQMEGLRASRFFGFHGQARAGNNPAIPRCCTLSCFVEDNLDSAI